MVPQYDKVAFKMVAVRNRAKENGDDPTFIEYVLLDLGLIPCSVCDEIIHIDDAFSGPDDDYTSSKCKACLLEEDKK